MEVLITGLVLFLGVHSVSIVNEAFRNRMVKKIGLQPWQGIHTLTAIVGFVLIVWGYGLARQEPLVLYQPPNGLRHLAMLLLVPVFPMLIAAYLPGRIRSTIGHPMLAATKLWAFAHLLANGMLHDLILFGAFLAWSVVDRISLGRRQMPPLRSGTPSLRNDMLAVVIGLLIYLAFLFKLHAWLIGVSPVGGALVQ